MNSKMEDGHKIMIPILRQHLQPRAKNLFPLTMRPVLKRKYVL